MFVTYNVFGLLPGSSASAFRYSIISRSSLYASATLRLCKVRFGMSLPILVRCTRLGKVVPDDCSPRFAIVIKEDAGYRLRFAPSFFEKRIESRMSKARNSHLNQSMPLSIHTWHRPSHPSLWQAHRHLHVSVNWQRSVVVYMLRHCYFPVRVANGGVDPDLGLRMV